MLINNAAPPTPTPTPTLIFADGLRPPDEGEGECEGECEGDDEVVALEVGLALVFPEWKSPAVPLVVDWAADEIDDVRETVVPLGRTSSLVMLKYMVVANSLVILKLNKSSAKTLHADKLKIGFPFRPSTPTGSHVKDCVSWSASELHLGTNCSRWQRVVAYWSLRYTALSLIYFAIS